MSNERLLVNSVFIEKHASSGNVRIGLTHSRLQPGAGLLRHDGAVVIERADVADVIRGLQLAIDYGWTQ